ncbi:MAG: hypothetical protein QOE07_817, partial [Acidimicrobiaceae bacterium]|nr:hypothetical protein [Acidimicrobiaceae bacterium]
MQSNPQPLDRGTRTAAVDVAVIDEFRSWFGPERTDQFATLVLS